ADRSIVCSEHRIKFEVSCRASRSRLLLRRTILPWKQSGSAASPSEGARLVRFVRVQQRENERWLNYKGKWLSLLELRKVSASPRQNSSSVRAPMFSLLAVVTRSLKKP